MPFWMRFAYKHFVNILIKRLSLATLDFWISILLSNLQFIRHIKARFYLNSAKNVLEVSILGFLYQRLLLQKKRLKMFLFKKAWTVLANKTSFLLKVNNLIGKAYSLQFFLPNIFALKSFLIWAVLGMNWTKKILTRAIAI